MARIDLNGVAVRVHVPYRDLVLQSLGAFVKDNLQFELRS